MKFRTAIVGICGVAAFGVMIPAQAQVLGDGVLKQSDRVMFDPSRDASKDLALAIKLARKSNKRILVDLGGEWCGWCTTLAYFFVENKDVAKTMHENYIVLQVNFSQENENKKALSSYSKMKKFPVLMILDKNGNLLHLQETDPLANKDNTGYDKQKILDFLDNIRLNPLSLLATLPC